MAWLPISYTVPQYLDTSVSPPTPASGFVLKAYQVGTTTNIPFATDNEGTTQENSIALNAQGYPEVSGNVVIPHMDQDYKLALYPSQTAANSDSGAVWTVDDIDLVQETDTSTAADYNVWPLVDYGGAYFDGTSDYLTRGAGLTGASDGKKGTLVAFVTFDNTASAIEYVLHATGGKVLLRRDADGKLRVIAENTAGSTILNMATSNAYETPDTVYCVMASWDLATPGSNQLYVNDTSDVVTTTFTNDTIDYTVADWAVGADVSGSNKMTGNVLSVWLDTTDNLDFDTELNRRRFLDEQDNPVYLGVQGELPTGSQPLLFLGNFDETEFEKNRGSGGDFTENGTLAAASVTFDGQYQYNRFPNVNADVTATDEELNKLDGFTGSTANLNNIDGLTVDISGIGAYPFAAGDIATGAVGQGELNTNNSTETLSVSGSTQRTLAGGSYGFYPQTAFSVTGTAPNADVDILHNHSAGFSERTNITLTMTSGAGENDSLSARQFYIQASPPYDLGDGQCGLFIEADVLPDGSIAGLYVASDPVWANNGPTSIRPDRMDKNTGRKYKRMRRPALTKNDLVSGRCDISDYIAAHKEASIEEVEITQEYKNADMDLIPHSWASDPFGTICLLDPVNTHDLLMLHEAGEDVADLIHKGYIQIGDEVQRKGPPGVVPVTFKWRNSR